MQDDLLSIKSNNRYYLYHRKSRCFYISDELTNLILDFFSKKYISLHNIDIHDLLSLKFVNEIPITYDVFVNKINYIKECYKCTYDERYLKNIKITLNDVNRSIANIKQIILEVTERCNLNCYYCCYGKLYNCKRTNEDIKEEDSFKALDAIISLMKTSLNNSVHNKVMITFYGGEPLLNINYIKKSIEYFKSQESSNIKFFYSMTTNGVLLDQYIDYLYEKNFKINISLDGNKDENSYRLLKNNQNSYDIIWRNLEFVKSKYPFYYEENISFISVLHNKNNLLSLYKYFNSIDKRFYYSILHKSTVLNSDLDEIFNTGLFQEDDLINLKKESPELYNKIFFEFNNINEYLTLPSREGDLFYDKNTSPILPTRTCFLFQTKIFLTVSGLLLPCEKANLKFAFGTYDYNGLEFDLKKIEAHYNKMLENFHTSCAECYNNNNCNICYFVDDQVMINNSICHTDKIKFVRDLTRVLNNNENKSNWP